MANEYKQCPNGHYYQGAQCPYCKTGNETPTTSPTSTPTIVQPPIGGSQMPTETIPGYGGEPTKTTVVGGENTVIYKDPAKPSTHTVFGDEEDTIFTTPGASPRKQQGGYRTTRMLVGWLVSYTLDNMGVDYKLYEGRNIIGRDADCNISVNDNMVSGRHAVLLFRAGKYSITDSQSSHGTFVNDNDIELEPCYLQDGDMIRMGKTLFKFRSSL